VAGVKLKSGKGGDEFLREIRHHPFLFKPITGRKYRNKRITGSQHRMI
jgi:hypothetical protein